MDEELRHREIDIPGITLFLGNHQPSITSVLRAVKRAEHGILNCIASIVHDYEFVNGLATAFTPFPLLPNLRCGLWYAATTATTDSCYFKSTDGHSGEWSFSTARLNLHVAQIAALHGGVCIVDATRRGKSFPDSLTKTIPIWATVINKALAKLKGNTTTTTATTSTTAFAVDEYFSSESLDLHLPHWISKNERHQIEQRIDTWVDEFLALGVDLAFLQTSLRKPLRCAWVSQEDEEEDWLDISENEELKSKYTVLVLISASIPNKRQRRRLVITTTTSDNGTTTGRSSSDKEEDGNYNDNNINHRAYTTSHQHSFMNFCFKEPVDLMYDYIPGAGDDEESWAKGLTPPLMWENIEKLLHAGPEDIEEVVKRVVKSKAMSDRKQKWTGAGARAVERGGRGGGKYMGNGGSIDWKVQWIAGCVGIGLSRDAPEKVFKKEGKEKRGIAVLNVGSLSNNITPDAAALLELAGKKLNRGEEEGSSTRYLHLPVSGEKNLKRAVLHAVPAAVQFASKHLSSSSSSSDCANTLKNKLLVIAEPEAIDIAASIVVAILIACFIVEDGCITWSRPARLFSKSTTQLIPARSDGTHLHSSTNNNTSSNSTNEFTRTTVRQYLSLVSAYYPQVVLSKSLLKQIYNAFLSESMVCPRPSRNEEESS